MPYKIPDDATLSKTIVTVATRKSRIESQRELVDLVRKELAKKDPDFRAGAERIRRTAIEEGIMRVEIEYRESESAPVPEICPVCRNAMESVRNMSLDGDIVEVKRKCSVCSYGIGREILVPGKYVFIRIGKKDVSERDIQIRKLKKARAKMREASTLIGSALHMTGMEGRGEYAKSMLALLSDSREEAGSIYNIMADLNAGDSKGPVWTRPTVSVKNENRKDI